MKNRRNYYRILHVQPDAPLEIIKSSYRALLLKLKKHPDLGGDHWESTLLNEAKEVLIDPRKRSKYDRDFLKPYSRSSQSKSSCASERVHPDGSAGMSSVFSGAVSSHACRFCNKVEQHSVSLMPETRCSSCHSPLYPTHKIKNSGLAKRAFQRIAKDFVITYYIEWPSLKEFHGQTSQLSPTGMQFCTDQYLQPGQIIKINSRYVEAVAKAVYCLNSSLPMNNPSPGNIIGVEFLAFISLMTPGTFVSQTS
ncbi:MAG: DnaJ domain-containing protein [Desulforhopalus sp.]|nr:DnaJ domain-containing protein [Desulforhopalus sp.]